MSAKREKQISAFEVEQYGAVSTSQLLSAGLSHDGIYRRVRGAHQDRVRRGVLRNASVTTSYEQRVVAAVLAGGDGAFASHESAARFWQSPLPRAALVEITTAIERRVRLHQVRCHRSSVLIDEDDVCVHRGIRVSSPERTIVDLSGRFDLKVLGRMLDDALRRQITTYERLVDMAVRLRPAPGRSQKKMFVVLARRSNDVAKHESLLEDFVFDALRRFGLPLPTAQHEVRIKGRIRRIDHCYVEQRLALEAIGFDVRRQRAKFDDEALRGNELQLAEFKVLQFTSAFTDWQIACQVAEALGLGRPTQPSRPRTFLMWCEHRDRLGSSRP